MDTKRHHHNLGYFFLVLLTLGLASFAYAQLTLKEAVEVETIHVFPETVRADGWKNVDAIGVQNVSENGLYQDFNTINSASFDLSASRRLQLIDEDSEEVGQPDIADEEKLSTEAVETVTETDLSTTTLTAPSSSTPVATSTVAIPTSAPAPVASTSVVSDDASESENEEKSIPSIDEGATTTVMRRIGQGFEFAFKSLIEFMPFVTSGTSTDVTATSSETVEPPHDQASDEQTEGEEEQNLDVQEATTTDVGVSDTLANDTESVIEEEATSSVLSDVPVATTTPLSSNLPATSSSHIQQSEANEETLAIEPQAEPCLDNCVPYAIELTGFGLPIFDDGRELSGAQLRMSFAAKRKSTRDLVQSLAIRYSFDDGTTWESAGEIIIDDEASNSLNGGYYLFALPHITDPLALEKLSVQLFYKADPAELEALYVDSVWLELFTTKGLTLDATELYENFDDGFTEGPLTGDELRLPDGEIIDFDFTDSTQDETLIIKSNEITYSGLSRSTIYFNVTNEGNRPDDFSLVTHFPDGVGTVTALEEWNRNKPKQVVLPEYRPYVYHCEAGWEVTDEPITTTAFSPLPVIQSESQSEVTADTTATTTTSTSSTVLISDKETVLEEGASEELSIPPISEPSSTSKTTEPTINPEPVSNESDEALPAANGTAEFLQASTSEPLARSTSFTLDTATSSVEIDEERYRCPDTQVVRTCETIAGEGSECRIENVKVAEHALTAYAGGWEEQDFSTAALGDSRSFFKKVTDLLGFGPDRKDIPEAFEPRAHTDSIFTIAPGETKYFKLEIEYPVLSRGEFWIETIGDREYGLLDPFWSSNWQYRIPILVDNTNGTEPLYEQQIFLELDSSLSDFWSNVNNDGSDIRFVQETTAGNLYTETGASYQNPFNQNWQGRIAISIPASSVSEAVRDYPVFVDLSTLGSAFWSGVCYRWSRHTCNKTRRSN
ncbi:MAG: hypothetical protein R3B69_00315 [Candidatus Paceibacterota bacterium]